MYINKCEFNCHDWIIIDENFKYGDGYCEPEVKITRMLKCSMCKEIVIDHNTCSYMGWRYKARYLTV